MKTIKQTILGFALSVFSISASAQAPCHASFTYSTDATTCLTHFINTSTGTALTHHWYIDGISYTSADPIVSLPNGNIDVQLQNYTSSGMFCDSTWQQVNINCGGNTNTVTPSQASFTYYTDSTTCLTHFINTSTGTALTYQWYIDGISYTSTNPIVSLPNGNVDVQLQNSSLGMFCDSTWQNVNINCGGITNTVTPCQASFTYYTDSTTCLTHFINTSTGTALTYQWYIDGISYTSANPIVSLPNGNIDVQLQNYNSSGMFCDSTWQNVNISCGSGTVNPTGCHANASFSIFKDSSNVGNYFAYNLSTGTGVLSYLWNFGDGSTSTQQYPFHQYATPGHYIVCLTITATSGTATCTDSNCDSSSVHKMSAGFLMGQLNVKPQVTTGVKENAIINGLNAFPNPMADELTIEVELTNNKVDFTYSIIDALGQVVLNNKLVDSKTIVNTTSLDKGFYFLTISSSDKKSEKTIKLVK